MCLFAANCNNIGRHVSRRDTSVESYNMKAEGEKHYLLIPMCCRPVGGVGKIEWGASDVGSPVPMVKGNEALSSSSSPLASPR